MVRGGRCGVGHSKLCAVDVMPMRDRAAAAAHDREPGAANRAPCGTAWLGRVVVAGRRRTGGWIVGLVKLRSG